MKSSKQIALELLENARELLLNEYELSCHHDEISRRASNLVGRLTRALVDGTEWPVTQAAKEFDFIVDYHAREKLAHTIASSNKS